MQYFMTPLADLIEQFQSLPGIGYKTAQRLAFYVLSRPKEEAAVFARTLEELHGKVKYCKVCQNLTDQEICTYCANESRDKTQICVVEDPRNIASIERTREFKGLYHVLHGTISPMDGIGPEQLKIKELLDRLRVTEVSEIILATNPTVEGEATSMYISRLLKPLGIKVTRLAYGIPVGGSLEYADEITISRALEGRKEL